MKLSILVLSFLFLKTATAENVKYSLLFSSPKSVSLENNWSNSRINAPDLWQLGFKGNGVQIGIVDQISDISHNHLKSQIAINLREFAGSALIDDDFNGFLDDIYGWNFESYFDIRKAIHGTFISGVVAGLPLDDRFSGVAPEAKVIPAGFIASNGGGNLQNAYQAIRYAIARGAKIINMSWGGAGSPEILESVIRENPNVLFVAAAGNEDENIDFGIPYYPAALDLPNLIKVAASDYVDHLANFSNFGLRLVDVAAPGVSITGPVPQNGFMTMDGTQTATAIVSGGAALLWGAFPQATVLQIKQSLIEGSDPLGFPIKSGGRINLKKSFELLKTNF